MIHHWARLTAHTPKVFNVTTLEMRLRPSFGEAHQAIHRSSIEVHVALCGVLRGGDIKNRYKVDCDIAFTADREVSKEELLAELKETANWHWEVHQISAASSQSEARQSVIEGCGNL